MFETYWTNGRGDEVLDNNYALMDLTVYGRQEAWEDSPPGWLRRGRADQSSMRSDDARSRSRRHPSRNSDDLQNTGS